MCFFLGKLVLPPAHPWIKLDATRNDDHKFEFQFGLISTYENLKLVTDDHNHWCLRAKWPGENYLELHSFDCNQPEVLCQEYATETVKCGTSQNKKKRKKRNSSFEQRNSLDLMLNPALINENQRAINLMRAQYKTAFESVS